MIVLAVAAYLAAGVGVAGVEAYLVRRAGTPFEGNPMTHAAFTVIAWPLDLYVLLRRDR